MPEGPSLQELRRAHAELHERLDAVVARDNGVKEALAADGDLIVSMRPRFVAVLVQEIVRRYLDRVVLDLRSVVLHEAGALKAGTPLGVRKVGHWKVEIAVEELRGVLRTGNVRASFLPDGDLHVSMPILAEESKASASIRLSWDSTGLANVVCRDFEINRVLEGHIVRQQHTLAGALRLHLETDALTAEPRSLERTFRLKVDLTPESWQEVREALDSQDSLLKCGLAMDPDKVVACLRDLAAEGFKVTLPDALFQTVRLPTSVERSVLMDGRKLQLSVETQALRVTPRAAWSSAAVHTHTQDQLRTAPALDAQRPRSASRDAAHPRRIPASLAYAGRIPASATECTGRLKPRSLEREGSAAKP